MVTAPQKGPTAQTGKPGPYCGQTIEPMNGMFWMNGQNMSIPGMVARVSWEAAAGAGALAGTMGAAEAAPMARNVDETARAETVRIRFVM